MKGVFHWCNHQSGITKILGTVPSCPPRPKYPHSPLWSKVMPFKSVCTLQSNRFKFVLCRKKCGWFNVPRLPLHVGPWCKWFINERQIWGSAAQLLFLAYADHQIWGISSKVSSDSSLNQWNGYSIVQTTQHRTNQHPPKNSCKPADFRQTLQQWSSPVHCLQFTCDLSSAQEPS